MPVPAAAAAADTTDCIDLTEPLRHHKCSEHKDLSKLSRTRFITVQMVTVVTAFLTCITMFLVSITQNVEMQHKLFSWSQNANCLLNATEDMTDVQEPKDWITNLLVYLSKCKKIDAD